jgi:hypothetical protein
MSYFNKPKLYNTGYLLDDTNSRLKQGLMSQDLSSDCFNTIPNLTNNLYCKNCNLETGGYKFNNPFNLAQKSSVTKVQGPLINKNLMYPIYNPPINYGSPAPPMKNCSCTQYIQSP